MGKNKDFNSITNTRKILDNNENENKKRRKNGKKIQNSKTKLK